MNIQNQISYYIQAIDKNLFVIGDKSLDHEYDNLWLENDDEIMLCKLRVFHNETCNRIDTLAPISKKRFAMI